VKKLKKVDTTLSEGTPYAGFRESIIRIWQLGGDEPEFLAKEVTEIEREGAFAIDVGDTARKLKGYYVKLELLRAVATTYLGIVHIEPNVFEKASAHQREAPIFLCEWDGRKFWWYRDEFWKSTVYSDEEVKLLLWEKGRREQRKFERLAKAKTAAAQALQEARRAMIPEEVRLLVWERDGGRCVKCGSTEELAFDHIIPVAKGGSNTKKNVQLLCAKCNREKGDRIA